MKSLKAIVMPGIGDIVYAWYKLQHYQKLGYKVDLLIPDNKPHRGHQLRGMIGGINSIEFIKVPHLNRFRLVDPISLIKPNPNCLFQGIPLAHTNSFIEAGMHMNDFMKEAPVDYDIDFKINPIQMKKAEDITKRFDRNIFLYTSSVRTNRVTQNRPDPTFWVRIVKRFIGEYCMGMRTAVHLVGAVYDKDLMELVSQQLTRSKLKHYSYIDQDLSFVCGLLKLCDAALVHESGFIILADLLKTPCLAMYFKGFYDRKDEMLPYTGIVSPAAYDEKRMVAVMHYEEINAVKYKLKELKIK